MAIVINFNKACILKCSLERVKSYFIAQEMQYICNDRVASEEVTLQLIKSKCLPVLLYVHEACPLTTSDLQSLDHFVRFFIKP